MKKIITLCLTLTTFVSILDAQFAGDYRSASSGAWNGMITWERFNGTMWVGVATPPTPADGVITIRSPHTVTINSSASGDQMIIETGAILTIESTLTFNDGPGQDLTVNGTMNFNAGLLNGTGTVLISNAGTLMMGTNNVKTTDSGVSITNSGTMSWQEGGINGAALIINNSVFNISASALWQFNGGLTNNGTINKTSGSTTIATPWSSSGTINFSGGTLTSSDVFTNTGPINFSAGAAWQNNSTFNLTPGSVISGTGSFTNAGVLTLNINQVFPATLVFTNTNTINGNGALTVNNDFIIQGSITGNGAFTLNGNGDWQGGTLGRSLTIDAGRTLLLSTGNVKTSNSGTTITNNGTMTWQEGGINGGGAFINNNVFNINASALWQFSGGFTNSGTMNKTGGSTTISTPWSNSGTINFSGGSLTSSDVFTNSGTITFSSGAAWQNNSTFNHNTGSVVTGTGSFNNSGILSLTIPQVFPPTFIFSNTNNINGPGALTINNDFVIQGSITGGAMTLNGNGDWQGGTLGRSLTMASGRTLLISTGAVKTLSDGTTLTNNGTMSWTEGGINASGAVINNNVFNISANALWQFGGGFTNSGTMNKTGGSTTISTPWSNSGTINISGGTLTSSDVFTNSGTITFSSGAVWQNNSTFNHNTGSVVTGTGNFNNSGTLSLTIAQVFPSTLVFSNTNNINGPGALTINNDFIIQGTITGGALILNGNGNWQSGTLGRTLTVDAGRTLILSTSNVKTSNSGTTITNNGTMTWQEGGINGGGEVINNNLFNIGANALWQFNGGLTNHGILSITGTPNLNTPVANSSSGIIKGTGTILFSSTVANNGIIAPGLSPGILVVNGTQPFSTNSTLSIEMMDGSGAGTGHDQLQRNGNLTLAGTLTVTETGTVPDGIYTIVNLTTGIISGNFSTTNLPAGYSVLVNATNVLIGKNVPLSLTLLSFTANKMEGNKVNLQWTTSDEINVSHFDVEHSPDLINYSRLGAVHALNNQGICHYQFVDEIVRSKTNHYRLRMVDSDTSERLSQVITVNFSDDEDVLIFPTASTDKVNIHSVKEIVVRLFSMTGVLLQQKQVVGNDFIDLSHLSPGIYLLRNGEVERPVRILKM
jgi:hypothetical protein